MGWEPIAQGGAGMKPWEWALALAIGAGWAGQVVAATHYTTVTVYLPGESRPWTVGKHDPYAVWDAHSESVVGRETELQNNFIVVDSAPVVPEELYASDQDLSDSAKVWLPKGGLLVKMTGGEGNWFCTWRFDDIASMTQAQADVTRLHRDGDYLFCVQADANGKTSNPRVMLADFPAMLAITDRESGMNRYRNGVGAANSVMLSRIESTALPARAQLQVLAGWSRRHNALCLHIGLVITKTAEILSGGEQCFSAPGQSIDIAGGRYTLTTMGEHKTFQIRVDRPLDVHGLAPSVLSK
jgi:hypothetical protein